MYGTSKYYTQHNTPDTRVQKIRKHLFGGPENLIKIYNSR